MSELILNEVGKLFPRADESGLTHAIEDINFKANDGEFISIVGPSGCGKSTILRLIAGLIKPSFGSLSLDGEKIEKPSVNRGMVFQRPNLFPWLTVKENVSFASDLRKDTDNKLVDSLIHKVGLDDFKDLYPTALSGGMAQRVALIRTLVSKPEIMLLDEPLGALDAFTRMNMQDLILELWDYEKNLNIMVTHDVDEAVFMSTKVIVMQANPGRIKEIVDIDLDYPRQRTSPKFNEYRKDILELLNID
ncbi:ABC transporter ATP-binding protein [uncultured Anaerococcus sp.]|uniref:ABC transporter ATP-binding protein n=1 Tax=uncultured Anaerococcus sp. TaxID=293428 RepID=UPI0025CF8F0E|nr:ABC transporter ATP-binding protein [uncultured Anaerococcus sp.]